MSEVAELAASLVAIESINPGLGGAGSGEAGIARYVAEWCERAGLDTSLHELGAGRANVVAVAHGTAGGSSLMLNAHLDTVGVSGMAEPFRPRLEGGRLYGRGAYDMKGSLAACMLAAAAAKRRGLAGDVVLTAVADEELASIGTEAVVREVGTDHAIVTEPTEMRVAVAHRGFVHLEVVTHGQAAHGSRPDLGVDAIAKMGRVLAGVEALDAALGAGPAHEYLGTGSVHASLIEGGQEYSSYPARCTLQVERRTIPGETVEQAERELAEILRSAAAGDPAFSGEVRALASREPFEVGVDEPLVRSLRRQASAALGEEAEIAGVPFWADSALLAGAGIATALFGPRGEGAHAEVEWVDVGDLERCVEVYVGVAHELCG